MGGSEEWTHSEGVVLFLKIMGILIKFNFECEEWIAEDFMENLTVQGEREGERERKLLLLCKKVPWAQWHENQTFFYAHRLWASRSGKATAGTALLWGRKTHFQAGSFPCSLAPSLSMVWAAARVLLGAWPSRGCTRFWAGACRWYLIPT